MTGTSQERGYGLLSALKQGENYWIEAVLEKKNLDAVINFLHNITGKPVRITDRTGKVYACSEGVKMASADDHFVDIPQNGNSILIYDPAQRDLYYRADSSDGEAWIIIGNTGEAEYPAWLPYLEEVATAVKICIFIAHEKENMEHQFKKKLIEDILLWNASEIKELIRQNKYCLDLDKLYFVSIMEPVLDSKTDMETLYKHTLEWLKYHEDVVICSVWNEKYIIFICPNKYDLQTLESDDNWDNYLSYIRKHQKDIAKRFNIPTYFGIGRKYLITELHKSYQEALTALNISKLTGKKNSVTHYLNLGVFKLINLQETAMLRQFCAENLGRLLEHDRTTKGELLQTLRVLCDTDFDVNAAAQKMFLHFNTLRYRIKKIEELTGRQLDRILDRLNLFVAVKLHDLLLLNGLLGEPGSAEKEAADSTANNPAAQLMRRRSCL
ncbi:hypothetical protein Tph_c01140 [Thermacetogenium phaeum DSM 12270]|uniref:Uncharacterized protein n=1 Tax=Thermacetogenium phaeum (strain ATCC BAA-254 / DSM 26808 / PB) TaxID=1089553 RepID=K4LE65_THEPS|nr:hypothetical protein Tph_c01140 [Thermacetogenium phaeum DSM 12270]